MILTSDLVSRVIVSGVSLLYYLRLDFQIWCEDASVDVSVSLIIILFEVGIPNLVHGCILGWQCVAYLVTVTLTSGLVSRIIVSGAYLLYHLR